MKTQSFRYRLISSIKQIKGESDGTILVIGIDVERRRIEKTKNKEGNENVEKANE